MHGHTGREVLTGGVNGIAIGDPAAKPRRPRAWRGAQSSDTHTTEGDGNGKVARCSLALFTNEGVQGVQGVSLFTGW